MYLFLCLLLVVMFCTVLLCSKQIYCHCTKRLIFLGIFLLLPGSTSSPTSRTFAISLLSAKQVQCKQSRWVAICFESLKMSEFDTCWGRGEEFSGKSLISEILRIKNYQSRTKCTGWESKQPSLHLPVLWSDKQCDSVSVLHSMQYFKHLCIVCVVALLSFRTLFLCSIT